MTTSCANLQPTVPKVPSESKGGSMSEQGKATATLPQAPAVPQDPAPKSPVGGSMSQAEALAPCALVPGSPCVPKAPASSALAVSENPEKKVLATKVLGIVKWFNIRNGYRFIRRNDTREDVVVHQTAIIKENNPRKYLRSVGQGETVEFEAIEGEKGAEAARVTAWTGLPWKGAAKPLISASYRRRLSYCGTGHGPARKEGEIGEKEDEVLEGAQLQGPGHRNPTYLTRHHRRPPGPRPAPAVREAAENQPVANGPNKPCDRAYTTIRVARRGPPKAPSQGGRHRGRPSTFQNPASDTQQSGAGGLQAPQAPSPSVGDLQN